MPNHTDTNMDLRIRSHFVAQAPEANRAAPSFWIARVNEETDAK